jgi:hypothetical protein
MWACALGPVLERLYSIAVEKGRMPMPALLSPASVNGLVLWLMVLLTLWLALSLLAVIRSRPKLNQAASDELDELIKRFSDELRAGAGLRAGAHGRSRISKRDIQAEYRERCVRVIPRRLVGVTRYGGITISGTGFVIALPSLPHLPPLSAGLAKFLSDAGLAVAAIAMVFDGSEFLHDMLGRRRKRKNRASAPAGPAADDLTGSANEELRRRRERLTRQAKRLSARGLGDATEITPANVDEAWRKLVKPLVITPAAPPLAVRSARITILLSLGTLAELVALFGVFYLVYSWAKTKLPSGQYWPVLVVVAALFILYVILVNAPRVIAAIWERRGGLRDMASGIKQGLISLAGKGWDLARGPFSIARKDRAQATSGNAPVTETEAGQRRPTTMPEPDTTFDYAMRREHVMGSTTPNQGSGVPGGTQAPRQGSMFALGWLMAQLVGPLPHRPDAQIAAHLPTVAELDAYGRMQVAFAELSDLLSPYPNLSSGGIATAWESAGHEGFRAAVADLHLELLMQLADAPGQSNAYQLGRALSDMCWLPTAEAGADFFLQGFDRYRLGTLQTWLTQAGDALAAPPAAAVNRSVQNWQDWVDINASRIRNAWPTAHRPVIAALRAQAGAWHAALAGEADTNGPISPEAWVQAGQAILRTTRTLTLAAFRRFWPIVVVVAAATGWLLYLAIANSGGTAKVWTSLVTVAAGLGVTAGSVRAAAKRAASGIGPEISHAASLDARAWSITWLPTLPQRPLQRYRLARRGVQAPRSRTRLQAAASAPEPQPPAAQAAPQVP